MRSWRKNTGRPVDTSTARAAAMRIGDRRRMASAESTRSNAYFTRNCQPVGSAALGATSGNPPRCSIWVSAGMRSKRRGTIAVGIPRSSQRRTMRSSTSSGAVENVTTTCSISKREITSSRSQLAPTTGTPSSSNVSTSGSLSRNAAGRNPSSGLSRKRLATSAPTRPAPTMSVGRTLSPTTRARWCDQYHARRPAET